jgi:hypothetical protein
MLRGGIDTHIHSAPSIIKRPFDDIELAQLAGKAGMKGIVIKAHESCTAGRAYLAEKVSGVKVYGGICLNLSVGGLNVDAVETSLKMGGRFVWMPTVSARNHLTFFSGPEGKKIGFPLEGKGEGITIVDSDGKIKTEVRQIIELVAQYDAVLATGHLGLDEILKIVDEAQDYKSIKIVATHPDINFISVPLDVQKKMAQKGVFLEKCYNYHLPPLLASSIKETAFGIKYLGPEHCILSSDLGQIGNPSPVEGIEAFIRGLLENGLTEKDISRMWVENPSYLC